MATNLATQTDRYTPFPKGINHKNVKNPETTIDSFGIQKKRECMITEYGNESKEWAKYID